MSKDFENIQVRKSTNVKDRLRVYAFNNGRLTYTQALEKLLNNQTNNE